MPHPCQDYPWFDPAGSLIQTLDEQRETWGSNGFACFYDDQNAYNALVALNGQLSAALSDPSPWTPAPWTPVVPPLDSGNVVALGAAISGGLPDDEANNPTLPVPHTAGAGWLLTPVDQPNWTAINRAQDLLERIRGALDI